MAILRAVLIVGSLLAFCALSVVIGWAGGVRKAAAWSGPLCCRALLALLRLSVVEEGPRPASGGRLLVANHVSWIDVLVLGSREPLCFLAKREVGTWPVIAAIARRHGTVFIDRGRRRAIPAANRDMAARMAEGRSVLLFPEGTTYDGSRRGRFLTSHLAALRDRLAQDATPASVQAAALAYSDPAAAWCGDAELVPHLWAMLTRPPVTCRLRYGTPHSVERGFDRKRLGRALAAEVEALLAPGPVPVTARAVEA